MTDAGQQKAEPTSKRALRHNRWEYVILALIIIVAAVVYNIIVSLQKHSAPVVTDPPMVQTEGGSFDSIVQQGHSMMDRGVYVQAIRHYETALKMDSLHPDIMVDLGACYHAIGEMEEALFQFGRALAMNPRHPVAMFNMGVVNLSMGDTTATKNWWAKYLEVAGDAPQAEVVREQLKKF